MNNDSASGLRGWFGRRPTGLKMLMILSLGLLPLLMVAVMASIDAGRANRLKDEMKAQAVLAVSAQRLSSALSRSTIIIQASAHAIGDASQGSGACRRTLERLLRLQNLPVRFALFDQDGQLRCATPGYIPPVGDLARSTMSGAYITSDGEALRTTIYSETGIIEGVGEFPRETLARLATPPETARGVDLDLRHDGRTMVLWDGYRDGTFTREIAHVQPLAGGLEMQIRTGALPIRPIDFVIILLPVLMWVAAALIGWGIVHRLILRPLVRMQGVIAAYRPGDQGLDLPEIRSPAREISSLGRAFDQLTRTVAQHEADLEAAVERQTRLVREVHHRVKNNLQVVASLLNLHSRGSRSEEVAAAYASIQRRVDALAVVHRNHYAELEENRGVALKPLVSELGANLRATAPPSAAQMQVRLDIAPFHVTQDVAVSVAFFVTEVVEFGMLCGARQVSIIVEPHGPGTASLIIESDSLRGEVACDEALFQRFDRIVTGLSRQLRSALERDTERGRYCVQIAVVEQDGPLE